MLLRIKPTIADTIAPDTPPPTSWPTQAPISTPPAAPDSIGMSEVKSDPPVDELGEMRALFEAVLRLAEDDAKQATD